MCGFDSCYPCLFYTKKSNVKNFYQNLYGYKFLHVNFILKSTALRFHKSRVSKYISAPRVGPFFRSQSYLKKFFKFGNNFNSLPISSFQLFIPNLRPLKNNATSNRFFCGSALIHAYSNTFYLFYTSVICRFLELSSPKLVEFFNNFSFFVRNPIFLNQPLSALYSLTPPAAYLTTFSFFRAKDYNALPTKLFLTSPPLLKIRTPFTFKNLRFRFKRPRLLSKFWFLFSVRKLNRKTSLSFFNHKIWVLSKFPEASLLPRYVLFSRVLFNELNFGDNGVKRFEASAYFFNSTEIFQNRVTRITRTQSRFEPSDFFNLKNLEFYHLKHLTLNLFMCASAALFLNDSLFENKLTFASIKASNFSFNLKVNFTADLYEQLCFTCLIACKYFSLSNSSDKHNLVRPFFFSVSPDTPNKVKFKSLFRKSKAFVSKTYQPKILGFSSYFSTTLAFGFLFTNPLFFKKLVYTRNNFLWELNLNVLYQLFSDQIKKFFFYENERKLCSSNILPQGSLIIRIKKKFLKVFFYQKFTPLLTTWYFNTFIRFIEHCSGKKTILRSQGNLLNVLSSEEKARCLSWAPKLRNFRKLLGPNLFLAESLQILYAALKLKDPYFLSSWMTVMFQKISFWKYKAFLRYFKYILRYFFFPNFKELGVIGIKMRLKGKISVSGNARTRTVLQRTGKTGHSTFNNKVISNLSLVRTFTGVQGFKLWIFF